MGYRAFAWVILTALSFSAVSCGFKDSIRPKLSGAKAKVEATRAKFKDIPEPEPVTVSVIAVGTSSNVGLSSYVGTVESSAQVVINAPVSGTLVTLNVSKGQHVKSGQVIAKVESQAVRSAYETAEATLRQAEDGYERLSKVYESGSIPQVRMVEMRTNLEKARAAEEAARKALWHCTVKSPISGVVDDVFVSRGVEVDIAAALVRIVDVNDVEISFPLPENEFSSVNVGDSAKVSVPAIGKTVDARVSSKGAMASKLSHSYSCTLSDISDKAGLMPGMVCKVSMRSEENEGVVVPMSAVMTDMNGRYLWTVSDGVVAKTYITVGGYSGDGIVVSDGLEEGMSVIVEGSRKVSTGMKVNAVEYGYK